jgi:hypothetical protein
MPELRRAQRQPLERAQGFALDVLKQSPAFVMVREDGHSEVEFRDQLEQQDVAERAAMRRRHHS